MARDVTMIEGEITTETVDEIVAELGVHMGHTPLTWRLKDGRLELWIEGETYMAKMIIGMMNGFAYEAYGRPLLYLDITDNLILQAFMRAKATGRRQAVLFGEALIEAMTERFQA